MWRPNSVWQWALILIAFFQAAVVLSFEGYVFARFQVKLAPAADGKPEELTIPTFLTLFIFGCIYQLVLVIDALRLKNTIQVIGICLLNVAELVYAAIQKDQLRDAFDSFQAPTEDFLRETNPFLIAVPCVLAVGTVLMSFVAWKLYNEFAWTIYKHISADLRLKRRYLAFQIYIALLKFDFFFFLGFTVQFMVIMINIHDYEFGLTIAAIPVTILILFMAAYWTRKENRVGMVIIIVSVASVGCRSGSFATMIRLLTMAPSAAALFCRLGVLLVQVDPHVPAVAAVHLRTRACAAHLFRRHHRRPHCPHHHQRLRVHVQLWPWSDATRGHQTRVGRGRQGPHDRRAQLLPGFCSESNGDRLKEAQRGLHVHELAGAMRPWMGRDSSSSEGLRSLVPLRVGKRDALGEYGPAGDQKKQVADEVEVPFGCSSLFGKRERYPNVQRRMNVPFPVSAQEHALTHILPSKHLIDLSPFLLIHLAALASTCASLLELPSPLSLSRRTIVAVEMKFFCAKM